MILRQENVSRRLNCHWPVMEMKGWIGDWKSLQSYGIELPCWHLLMVLLCRSMLQLQAVSVHLQWRKWNLLSALLVVCTSIQYNLSDIMYVLVRFNCLASYTVTYDLYLLPRWFWFLLSWYSLRVIVVLNCWKSLCFCFPR